MPGKDNSDKEAEEVFSQRKRPESGRYLLQVDKQTKDTYKTPEAAQSAALAIKIAYPIVQVSIYDSVDNSTRLVELPDAASQAKNCPCGSVPGRELDLGGEGEPARTSGVLTTAEFVERWYRPFSSDRCSRDWRTE